MAEKKNTEVKSRAMFASRIGAIAATVGSAVGLGYICGFLGWRNDFPGSIHLWHITASRTSIDFRSATLDFHKDALWHGVVGNVFLT